MVTTLTSLQALEFVGAMGLKLVFQAPEVAYYRRGNLRYVFYPSPRGIVVRELPS